MGNTRASGRIGPYQILAPLGAGGMAETYLALKRGPGGFEQRVCLKRIRHDFAADPDLVRQFMAEASIAASLRHATIAQVLDFGVDGDDYYLALELIDGLDLHQLLHRLDAPLSAALTLHVAVELATALDLAHRAPGAGGGIVHRDVSPSNVLISTEGEVKLTDFGIARASGGPRHTRTGIVKGKVPYMAPEYARTAQLDARADLFALGVLIYECLTGGTRPYDGTTDLETLERSTRGEHTPLSQLAPTAPSPLVEAVERLIEPAPELRFQTAAELLDTLLDVPAEPGARRELGALVRRLRPETAPPHGDAPAAAVGDESDPALAATLEAPSSPPLAPTRTLPHSPTPPAARGGSRVLPWLSLAISLLALGAFGYASFMGPGREPAPAAAGLLPVATTAAEPEPAVPVEAPVGLDAPAASAVAPGADAAPAPRPAEPARRPPPVAKAASLEVVVVPYGDVFVDGERVGSSPARVRLPPGSHVVEGKGPHVSTRERVELVAGQHRKVMLR